MQIFRLGALWGIAICAFSAARIATAQEKPTTIPISAPANPREVLDMPADQAYRAALYYWATGKQGVAEQVIAALSEKYPADSRIAFFEAACDRSRFDVRGAIPLFQNVIRLAPGSPEAMCAGSMIKLDSGIGDKTEFAKLNDLAKQFRDDPMIVWMAAVQCRSLNENEIGIAHYKRLTEIIEPNVGPVLLHQTFANLLDEAKRFEEALEHRRIAVKLEPAPWSIEGLGNTLKSLKRYKEAEAAYNDALKLSPNDPRLIWDISSAQYDARQYEKAMETSRRALQIDPGYVNALITLGLSLENTGQWDDALNEYQKARQSDPKSSYGYNNAIRLLNLLGRKDEASALDKQWTSAGGKSFIAPVSAAPGR